jgi:hypothetical protein
MPSVVPEPAPIGNAAPDYAYDVFLSYRRTKLVRNWVVKYFKQAFVNWLHEARGLAPRVFWDEEELGAGDDMHDALRSAVLRSKCLVAVLSPSYFRESRWCVSEFYSFRRRSERLGMTVPGLVVPALWYGRDKLPAEARGLQMLEFERFANMKSPTQGFDNLVKNLAERVDQVLAKVPPYDPTFEFVWADRVDEPVRQRTLAGAAA